MPFNPLCILIGHDYANYGRVLICIHCGHRVQK